MKKNPRDERGSTPINLAYEIGNFEICKLIIERIDNLDLPQLTMGRTNLLFQSATDGTLVVYKSIVENLVDKNPSDDYGYTPFHLAACLGHFDLCEIIIEYIWNKNPCNIDAVTPLHEAARQGHLKICRLIIDHTKDIDVEDNDGQTPMHLAKENGHLEVVKLFDYQ